jgi:CrcB protein
MWQKITLIALTGALGALARYGLGGYVQSRFPSSFPWGTFAVNIVGSFLFGLIWALAEDRLFLSHETRVIILTGFMGSFTTFSTFMFESGSLAREGHWLFFTANLVGQCAVGLAALFLGIATARLGHG